MDEDLIPVDDPALIAQLEQPQSMINKGEAGGGDPKAQESERTAAFLATRIAGGLSTLKGITPEDQRPGVAQEAVRGVFGDTAANLLTGSQRQRAEAAQLDILDAALTLGTGAAYNREQLEGYRKAYFPQIGDSEATVADKRQRLGLLLNAARTKAGSASPQIDEALKAAGFEAPAAEVTGGNAPVEISKDGAGQVVTERDRAYTDAVRKAVADGADKAALNALATAWGYGLWSDEDLAPILKARAEGRPVSIGNVASGYEGPSLIGAAAASPGGAFVTGAANALTAGTLDEIVGLTGGDAERAQQAKEVMREAYPVSSIAGELAGGAVAATGVGRIPGLASRALLGDVAYGTAYGAGESNDNRVLGAALGGGTAYGANKLFAGLSRYASRPRPSGGGGGGGQEVLAAADRLNAATGSNIVPLPADVGGATVRRLTGAAAQGPLSAAPIIKRAQQVTTEAQAARDKIAADIGRVLEPEGAGEAAQRGFQKWDKRSQTAARNLYNAAESMARGVEVPLTKAMQVLDEQIAELQAIPGGSKGLAELESLREELAGNWTVKGIRGMRTDLRDRFISDGLRKSSLEVRVGKVIDAASDDIADGLTAAGRDNAASAFRAADDYWKARVKMIDRVFEPILGKNNDKDPGEVVAALQRASKGNAARLTAFMKELPPTEQSTVRATFINQLGRASNTTQNAAGDAFSLPQFLTHWNQLTPRAKRALFDGESMSALNDLAKVAEGAKEAQRYQNFSNSAGGIGGQFLLTGGVGFAGGLPAFLTAAAAQYGAGRLLASPRFARWLARAPKTTLSPRAYTERLSRIAAAEPAIAQDVLGLQQALTRAFEQSPTRAAASGEEEQQ